MYICLFLSLKIWKYLRTFWYANFNFVKWNFLLFFKSYVIYILKIVANYFVRLTFRGWIIFPTRVGAHCVVTRKFNIATRCQRCKKFSCYLFITLCTSRGCLRFWADWIITFGLRAKSRDKDVSVYEGGSSGTGRSGDIAIPKSRVVSRSSGLY